MLNHVLKFPTYIGKLIYQHKNLIAKINFFPNYYL